MLKRTIDILVSGIVLLIIAIPFIFIFIILKLTGEREAFYFQERVGKGGKRIWVTKLVTMVKNAENIGAGDITLRDDPRVLPVGKFLRKTKLNEFPQFWDVFAGKLSLVGWRPLLPKGFADYSEEVQDEIVKVKPGLTGIGSLVFRDEEAIIAKAQTLAMDPRECYRDHIMKYKGALEVWYARHHNTWIDFKIVLGTAISVLRPGWSGYLQWFENLPMPESELVCEHIGLQKVSETTT